MMQMNLSADLNSGDTKKQISALKTQMASLKDSIEEDLRNISYEQLDTNLKKKIDNLTDLMAVNTETIDGTYGRLSAVEATVDIINANYITADTIAANYATIGSLNAQAARIDAIVADYIKASEISAISISASQITSGTISASRINTQNLFSQGQMSSLKIWCMEALIQKLWTNTSQGYKTEWRWNSSLNAYMLLGVADTSA